MLHEQYAGFPPNIPQTNESPTLNIYNLPCEIALSGFLSVFFRLAAKLMRVADAAGSGCSVPLSQAAADGVSGFRLA